jgi:two-component sensor histidine kinase
MLRLKREGDDSVVMTITDNGSTTESASSESLGGRLIHAFAKQLSGTVEIRSDAGFHLTLRMPLY